MARCLLRDPVLPYHQEDRVGSRLEASEGPYLSLDEVRPTFYSLHSLTRDRLVYLWQYIYLQR